MMTVKKSTSYLVLLCSLHVGKTCSFPDWVQFRTTAQSFQGLKPTSGLELTVNIGTFCQRSEGICVKSSKSEFEWGAGETSSCFCIRISLCARKALHLLHKASHLKLRHKLVDYCSVLCVKWNANFCDWCVLVLLIRTLKRRTRPFKHYCVRIKSVLRVTTSSYGV